ncbi:MAG: hypothetical protein M0P13_10180 [Fibrobacteraceae bacterium]|nr:hypothetical protein [Fibrobacteraceae bacterium]
MQNRRLKNRGTWDKKLHEKKEVEVPQILKEIPVDLDGKKAYLSAWAKEKRIPGKIQGWYSVPCDAENCDWRILSEHMAKGYRILSLEGPYKGAKPPKSILEIDAQIRKEHLTKFRGSILQIWFRSTGDGRFGIAVQNILHSAEAAHGLKTFMDYLQHNQPEILCCHQLQTRPIQTFNPAHPVPGISVNMKQGFGSEFLPIASTPFKYSVIDWTPQAKSPWIGLPQKLKEIIHPSKDDKFLECHSGPAYLAEALAPYFAESYAMDSRNIKKSLSKAKFYNAEFGAEFLQKFFRGKSKEGKWTIFLNPPDGAPLPGSAIQAIADCRVERILLCSSNLNVAEQEIRRFRRQGYMLRKIIPLDLEPGTPHFDVLFFFVPDRAGLLGHSGIPIKSSVQKQPPRYKDEENTADTIHFTEKRRR